LVLKNKNYGALMGSKPSATSAVEIRPMAGPWVIYPSYQAPKNGALQRSTK